MAGGKGRKGIGLVLADFYSESNRKLVEGIISQANKLGYDVYCFTYFSNSNLDFPFMDGEENIMNLLREPAIYEKLDGIIGRINSFSREKVRVKLREIFQEIKVPYIDIDDSDTDPDFKLWEDGNEFEKLVIHLIEVHRKKKIYCLTGPKNLHQSIARLNGYKRAMDMHNIPYDDSYIFYGDFWEDYPKELADRIARGIVPMPDAIACANSPMAISLIDTLRKNDIKVPEHIAVVSYDSYLNNLLHSPTVTTLSDTNYNQGIKCASLMHKKITGQVVPLEGLTECNIEPGESCGCVNKTGNLFQWYKENLNAQLRHVDLYLTSNMMQEISASTNLESALDRLHHFIYLLRNLRRVHVCLCDDWDGLNTTNGDDYRKVGYSKNLIGFSCMVGPKMGVIEDKRNIYTLEEMISSIYENEKPSSYYFLPMHYQDRCFGFACMEFRPNCYSLDKQVWVWVDNLSNALEAIRIRHYIQHFSERVHLTVIRDPLTGFYNRRGFEELSSEMAEQAIFHKEKLMILAIDVYRLKDINNKYGNDFGDRVLLTLADAINQSCYGNEICCRCGDDNFYIIGSNDYKTDVLQTRENSISDYYSRHMEKTEDNTRIQIDFAGFCEPIDETVTVNSIQEELSKEIRQKHNTEKKQVIYLKNLIDLRRSIYEFPQKNWNIDYMAKLVMLSRAYFQRLYKKNFGVSAMSDVITARIILAKHMLTSPNHSISEISSACGYSSEIYFMQQFKRETGMTPTQYRKENIGQTDTENIEL